MDSSTRMLAKGLFTVSRQAARHSFAPSRRRFLSSASCNVPPRCSSSTLQSPSITQRQRSAPRYSKVLLNLQKRHNSSDASSLSAQPRTDAPSANDRPLPADGSTEPVAREVPSYDLTFTCKPCRTRSTHRISKQGYHKGTVLITCPECKNRHLIADHLKIFADKAMTIDKFLEEQGEVVRRGRLGPEGDIEVWDNRTDDPQQGRHVGAPYRRGEDPDAQN